MNVSPIPTKPVSALLLDTDGLAKYPPIEQFIHDCYLYSLDKLDDVNTIELINDFHKYTKAVHSQENLNFLLALADYEDHYNKYFNVVTKSVSLSHKDSENSSDRSVRTEENFPTNYFASTIEDISQANYWETFKFQNVNAKDKDSDDGMEDGDHDRDHDRDQDGASMEDADMISAESFSEEEMCLIKKWQHILTKFVYPDSELQINLSNSNFKLMTNQATKYPDPAMLIGPKREILQLLNENAYHRFIKKSKHCPRDIHNTSPCDDCSCGANSASNSPSISSAPAQYRISPITRSPINKLPISQSATNTPFMNSPLISPSVSSVNSNISLGSKKKKLNFWDHLKSSTPTSDDERKFRLWSKKKVI